MKGYIVSVHTLLREMDGKNGIPVGSPEQHVGQLLTRRSVLTKDPSAAGENLNKKEMAVHMLFTEWIALDRWFQ